MLNFLSLSLLALYPVIFFLSSGFPFPFAHLTVLFSFFQQERFQVKNPPHTYLQKLRSYLDPAVTRKVSTLANMLSCSTGLAVPLPQLFLPLWPLYLLSRISPQLRKDCTQCFWSRQLGSFSYKTVNSVTWWERRQLFIWNAQVWETSAQLKCHYPWILTNP